MSETTRADERRLGSIEVTGYADRWSARPGQDVSFFVSTSRPTFEADVVRLLGGMTDPASEDVPTREVAAQCNGSYPGRLQHTHVGSYASLPLPRDWLGGDYGIRLRFLPTTPDAQREQVIVGSYGPSGRRLLELSIGPGGRLLLRLGISGRDELELCPELDLQAGSWYDASVDRNAEAGTVRIRVVRVAATRASYRTASAEAELGDAAHGPEVARTLLAAGLDRSEEGEAVGRHLNGRIENPAFWRRALAEDETASPRPHRFAPDETVVAYYDFGDDFDTTLARDISPSSLHGRLHNAPQRAVTGSSWDGTVADYRLGPDHYAAVHFHDDDLCDASWSADIRWTVPDDLSPGPYALRLRAGDDLDYIPFFVRGGSGRRATVTFLVPTLTYQAYANEHLYEAGGNQQFMEHEPLLSRHDRYVLEHPEVGKSVYDVHSDGSGVTYSSRLRPILNLRPHQRNWLSGHVRHLAADLFILGWLDDLGIEYDVLADEDLHREGVQALEPHRVVITGSHPEYWSRPMMRALTGYLDGGGRLMYLGGNGFYWVTSVFDDRQHLIEVRRGNVGTRSWDSPPGEATHSASGDPGGLWRYNGHPPNGLVGVGMASQGWGRASSYRRLPAGFDERVAALFDGIDEDEPIGGFGYVLGGAAGDEVDRFAPEFGTPPHTLRLATSLALDDRYQLVQEEQLVTSPGQGGADNDRVRADMTYLELDGGGLVFSVGSICWAGSLAWNGYDNNVARLTTNVLERFMEPAGGTTGHGRELATSGDPV